MINNWSLIIISCRPFLDCHQSMNDLECNLVNRHFGRLNKVMRKAGAKDFGVSGTMSNSLCSNLTTYLFRRKYKSFLGILVFSICFYFCQYSEFSFHRKYNFFFGILVCSISFYFCLLSVFWFQFSYRKIEFSSKELRDDKTIELKFIRYVLQ